MVTLVNSLPVTGPPDAVLVDITIGDIDEDGIEDVDNIQSASKDLTLAISDAGMSGEFHVMVVLYMEGGGIFQPVSDIDYMGASQKVTLGLGQVSVDLQLQLTP